MSRVAPNHCCRTCGATSYRRVIARDGSGALRSTELYQCSGCSVVFADPKAWRDGGVNEVPVPPPVISPMRPAGSSSADDHAAPRPPDLATYGLGQGPAGTS